MAFLDLSLMLNCPVLLRRYISTYGTVESSGVPFGCCKVVGKIREGRYCPTGYGIGASSQSAMMPK